MPCSGEELWCAKILTGKRIETRKRICSLEKNILRFCLL